MRTLITGAAGFIGSNFVRNIVEHNIPGFTELTLIDKLTYAGSLENLENIDKNSYNFIHGDICDLDLIRRTTKGIDCIVNFAAESHVDNSINSPGQFLKTNVEGTNSLLSAALQNDVELFIQISTDEVYGSITEGSFDEFAKFNPSSIYSASKASADLLCNAYFKTHGMDIRITRSANNYGPNQHYEKLIPRAILRLLRGSKIPLYGNGSNMREWIYVVDNCNGILATIFRGKPGFAYNLGSGFQISNFELVKKLNEIICPEMNLIEFTNDRLGHDYRYSLNCEMAKTELNFEVQFDFMSCLLDTVSWYKENLTRFSTND